jgi:hypothetical protein
MIAVLILIAGSRILYLNSLSMNFDEIWSAWQTLGSLRDTIRWTPTDWPPLYFATLWGWDNLVGYSPQMLRTFSILASLVGAAFLYRATARWWGKRAAILSVLVYGALGFDVFVSLLIRGYILTFALTPLVFWLTTRYFDHPQLRRAIPLTLVMIVLFLTHYTSFFILALLGLYTLMTYGRRVWRWYLPAILFLPVVLWNVLPKWNDLTTRTGFNTTIQLLPLPQALWNTLSAFAGPSILLWVILFLIATIFLLRNRMPHKWFLACWLSLLVLLYLFQGKLGLFQDLRYIWWIIPGLVWWIGIGLSRLPGRWSLLTACVMVGGMYWPGLISNYQVSMYHSDVALNDYLNFLKQKMVPGDVVLVDKNNLCGPPESWDYFLRLSFPNGLPLVTIPGDHRRVWYVSADWLADPATKQAVQNNRIADEFFGPPACLFRLYEGAPDPVGILFENGLRFHGADISGIETPTGHVVHKGDTIHIKLWWSVDAPIKLDYSIGLYVTAPTGTGQVDGAPQVTNAPSQMSQWVSGRYYVDVRELTLPESIGEGSYPLSLAVYEWWGNLRRIPAPGVDAKTQLTLATIYVHSWN